MGNDGNAGYNEKGTEAMTSGATCLVRVGERDHHLQVSVSARRLVIQSAMEFYASCRLPTT
jgi:hypothetical protein